jgi:hypothetical protein
MATDDVMAIDGQAFESRYVMYFDFLGTRSAIENWPSARLHAFVDLLEMLVQLRGRQDIDGKSLPDGSYQITLKPEISTFSDHVVVSYPEPDMEDRVADLVKPLWADFICQDCIRVISAIAERALRQGLLLRGGISRGEQYHGNEVVFGEALVDAYRLESELAKGPRIVVSDRILSQLQGGPASHPNLVRQDSDGLWYLNYFPRMREHGVGMGGPDAVERWNTAMAGVISDNLASLVDPTQIAKWVWFQERFNSVL